MLRPRCTTLAARCAAASAMTTSRGGTQPRASSSVHIPVSPPLKNTAATSSSRGVPRAMVRRHRDWKRLSVSLSLRKVAEGMKSPVLTQRQRPQSQRPHGAGDGRALCSPTGPSQPGSHSNIPIFPARQISTPPPAARWWHSQEHPGAEPCCDRVCSPTHTYQHLAVVHGPRCVPQRPQGLKEKEHARLAKPKRGAHPACTASCTRETLTRGATQRRAATRRTPATLTVKPGLHPRTRPATERTAPLTTKAKERKRASKRPCLEVRDVTDASEDVRHVRGSRVCGGGGGK